MIDVMLKECAKRISASEKSSASDRCSATGDQ